MSMTDRQIAITSVVLGFISIVLAIIFYTIPFMELREWIGGLYNHLPFIILLATTIYLLATTIYLLRKNDKLKSARLLSDEKIKELRERGIKNLKEAGLWNGK